MGKVQQQKKIVSAYFVTLYYKHIVFIEIFVKDNKKTTTTGND